jgi:uncharacterized protein (DUF924 family)
VPDQADTVLAYWLGDCREDPDTINSRMQLWFSSSKADDLDIRNRFESLYRHAANGELHTWQQVARNRLALILLLDQFPRCLFRGQPQAFGHDFQAASLCLAGINQEIDLQLTPIERVFFYMPLQHVEDIVAQDAGVAAYRKLEDEQAEQRKTYASFREYAELHRDIIAKFGRFPHRNAILGRANTPEETVYLEAGAPTFGQSG